MYSSSYGIFFSGFDVRCVCEEHRQLTALFVLMNSTLAFALPQRVKNTIIGELAFHLMGLLIGG